MLLSLLTLKIQYLSVLSHFTTAPVLYSKHAPTYILSLTKDHLAIKHTVTCMSQTMKYMQHTDWILFKNKLSPWNSKKLSIFVPCILFFSEKKILWNCYIICQAATIWLMYINSKLDFPIHCKLYWSTQKGCTGCRILCRLFSVLTA